MSVGPMMRLDDRQLRRLYEDFKCCRCRKRHSREQIVERSTRLQVGDETFTVVVLSRELYFHIRLYLSGFRFSTIASGHRLFCVSQQLLHHCNEQVYLNFGLVLAQISREYKCVPLGVLKRTVMNAKSTTK